MPSALWCTSMRTTVNPSKSGLSILVEFEEGFSTYRTAVPMPYAIRFFLQGLLVALGLLEQSSKLQKKLNNSEGEREEIAANLQRATQLYAPFLRKT